ncbi:enoyl-CoA hydratase-related protein [Kitasatospora acidiphila]|uniref:enoyl-CoA hydratase-related protein n=1 Tax=Kitasatospora acidiphila TaxID=2567942 RepID=UPI001E2E086A|nr:enoyl-CoA hydratase-related protein [Kitasatospora acidiphila]
MDACVAEWTDDLLRSAPLSVRAIKEAAMRSVDMPLAEAFAAEFVWERRRQRSTDVLEGPRAFAEKRGPVWLGH